tara:strand:- start:42 stop:431 length:390 start_codon:yes stop_codon:yes gene_type:complete
MKRIYKNLILTAFVSLTKINKNLYDDPILGKYHTLIVVSLLLFLNYFSFINILAFYKILPSDTKYFLIFGGLVILGLHIYYLIIRNFFSFFLKDLDKINFTNYIVFIFYLLITIYFAYYSGDLLRSSIL